MLWHPGLAFIRVHGLYIPWRHGSTLRLRCPNTLPQEKQGRNLIWSTQCRRLQANTIRCSKTGRMGAWCAHRHCGQAPHHCADFGTRIPIGRKVRRGARAVQRQCCEIIGCRKGVRNAIGHRGDSHTCRCVRFRVEDTKLVLLVALLDHGFEATAARCIHASELLSCCSTDSAS